MRAIHTHGFFSAVIKATLITEQLLTSVKGDGPEPEKQTDITYAMIGIGVGFLLVALFFIIKICVINKQVCENTTELSTKRPSAPNLIPLNILDQSEHPVAAESSSKRC